MGSLSLCSQCTECMKVQYPIRTLLTSNDVSLFLFLLLDFSAVKQLIYLYSIFNELYRLDVKPGIDDTIYIEV